MDESSTLDCEYSGDAGDAYIAQARQQLLDLWENLIRCCIDKVSINEVSPIVFSVILWVMKRPEFDLTHLRWDVHRTPMCEHHVVLMEHRYRLLLIDTLELVVKNLDRFAETFQETARDVTDTADNTNESDYETRVDAMGVVGDIMDDCVPQFDDPLRSSSYVTTTPSLSPPPAISPPTSSAASSSLIIKSKTEGLGAGKEIKSLEMIDPLRTSLTSVQKEDNNNNEDGYDDDDYDEDEEEDVDDDEEEEDDETGSTNEQQQAFPVLGDPFFVLPASTMASQYKDRKKQSVQKRKKKKKDIHKKKQQQQQQQQQQPPKTSPPPLQPSPTPQPPSPPDSLYKTLSPSFGIFSAKVLACLFFRYPCKKLYIIFLELFPIIFVLFLLVCLLFRYSTRDNIRCC